MPKSTRSLPDVSIEQDVTQSVNIEGLFSGIRLTTTVSSSDDTKVTATKSRSGSSMGISAIAVGSADITVTGSNEAGSVTVSFKVTVTAQEE